MLSLKKPVEGCRRAAAEVKAQPSMDTGISMFEKKLEHLQWGNIMKKHFHAYAKEFRGSKELRDRLMETKN